MSDNAHVRALLQGRGVTHVSSMRLLFAAEWTCQRAVTAVNGIIKSSIRKMYAESEFQALSCTHVVT